MKKSEVLYKKDKSVYITKIITFTVIILICFLTVGYSAFSNTLRIEDILVTVRPVASARITNVTVSNVTNGAISNSEQFTKDKLMGNITLPNDDSTVTYKVDVTVFLSSEMKLTNITGLDPNLEYTISGYNFGDILCNSNNECNLGATDDVYITIGYKNGVNNSGNTTHTLNLDFNFEVVQIVAKIGNDRYETLQEAIDAVPTNNTETTIDLLMNTSEVLIVSTGQNITFNMHGNTISNNGSHNVIENTGTIRMSDGAITSNAAQGAINNNAGGVFIMSGGSITNTGGRQAIYNDGGNLTISGSAYLKSTSSDRAPVHNLNNGTVLITGGKIESTKYSGVRNEANLTIGVKDGTPAKTPVIMGKTYGVLNNSNINYYDGVIKGVTNAFYNENNIADSEPSLSMIRKTEVIDGSTYKVVELNVPVTITFNANTGSVNESSRIICQGDPIGELPVATKTNFNFDGWFTAASGGTEVKSTTTFNTDTEIFAHFSQTTVATIGDNEYPTLALAVAAVTTSTPTTIDIIEDIVLDSAITINANKNITFDLNNHTLSNRVVSMPIFENKGTTVIENGTITTNGTQGAINNRVNGANLTIDNLTIIATGTRQAIYNEGGNTTIQGNSHLSNISTERPAVQIKTSGTITIISATIESSNFSAVAMDGGTLNIGVKDGSISTSNPSITGETYGVEATGGTVNFYDGILRGITDAVSGTISDLDGTPTTGTSGNYKTLYLE